MHDTVKQQDDVENRGERLGKLLNNPKKAKAIQENKKDRSDARKEVRSPENLLRSRQDASTFDASKHVQVSKPERRAEKALKFWNNKEASAWLREECCVEGCSWEEVGETEGLAKEKRERWRRWELLKKLEVMAKKCHDG